MKLTCKNCKSEIDSLELIKYYGHQMSIGVVTPADYKELVSELKKYEPMISCEECSTNRENWYKR